jgi:hypothetical protein
MFSPLPLPSLLLFSQIKGRENEGTGFGRKKRGAGKKAL